MREGVRWLLALLIALVVIGLIAYARGPKHHHGDDVGALPMPALRSELS
jgi:cell division septation protein DedD